MMTDSAKSSSGPVRFGGERLEPLFRIGLKPLNLAQWFEVDDQIEPYRAEKDRLTASQGDAVFREETGTAQAQAEVRTLITDNLTRHHAHHPFGPKQTGTKKA